MNTEKLGHLGEIYDIPLRQIHVSDDNVRHHDPTKDLQELAASIKRHGLLQPVVLKGDYGEPPYELILKFVVLGPEVTQTSPIPQATYRRRCM